MMFNSIFDIFDIYKSPDVAVSISPTNDNVSLRLSLTVIMVATKYIIN
jgi:hypothetical protein